MLYAFILGLVATSSLILGGIIATRFSLSNRTLGIIMAFGAGTLISAVSYELILEAVKLGKGTGFPAFGLFACGAILIVLANSMMPEAYEHGKKLAGIFTELGFFVSVSIIVLENF